MSRAPIYPSDSLGALLDSDLVTPPTRRALRARLERPEVVTARIFDEGPFATLTAACARLLPRGGERGVDLAGELDRRLAEEPGTGWRYAIMPAPAEMHVRGLRGLDEAAQSLFAERFVRLSDAQQDAVLGAVQSGAPPGATWATLNACRYFEELLAAVADVYYAHPAALDEIGYAGAADARGWGNVGLGAREAHEPVAAPTIAAA